MYLYFGKEKIFLKIRLSKKLTERYRYAFLSFSGCVPIGIAVSAALLVKNCGGGSQIVRYFKLSPP
jgi:hypothetical protein